MRLCSKCHSDNVERTSSTGVRVIICLVLLFIPFGLLICWIPFAFPHTFRCNYCSKAGKEEELLSIDWRERETFLEKERLFKEAITPLLDKWFEQSEKFYAIKKWSNQFILFEIETYVSPYKIIDCESKQLRIDSKRLDLQVLDFTLNTNGYVPTKEGKELFSEEELSLIVNCDKKLLREYLKQHNLLIDPYEIKVGNKIMDKVNMNGI